MPGRFLYGFPDLVPFHAVFLLADGQHVPGVFAHVLRPELPGKKNIFFDPVQHIATGKTAAGSDPACILCGGY